MSNRLVDRPSERPESIEEILSTLKRYDLSVIEELQDYLQNQYESDYSDLNSNLALLKLYELSDESSKEREESTIKILIKGLTEFIDQDFTLYLHLLPTFVFSIKNDYTSKIQALVQLFELLISNDFEGFLSKNKELGLVNDHNLKLIEATFQKNKTSKFVNDNVQTEDVPVSRLSKVIGQLIE